MSLFFDIKAAQRSASFASGHTLAIIKPDAIEQRLIGEILHQVACEGLFPVAMRMERLDDNGWCAFYEEHRRKPFYMDLVNFMASGPCVFTVFSGYNAIARWRELMGATDPKKAKAGTLRGAYGTEGPANIVHGSDSQEAVLREIRILNHLLDQPFVDGVTP